MTIDEVFDAIQNNRDVWVKTREGNFVGPLRILNLDRLFVGASSSHYNPAVALLSNRKHALLNTLFFNCPDTAIIANIEEKAITERTT